MGVTKQIIGSFEDIGKSVVSEAVNVPKDIAGKALESLGTSSSSNQSSVPAPQPSETPARPKDAWDTFDAAAANAKAFARRALEAFRSRPVKKQPSVWERMNAESENKKQLAGQQQQIAASGLPMPTSKRPRGDLYGVKAKTLGGEIGKNVNTG